MGPASGKPYQNSTEISAEPPLELGLPNLYLQVKNNIYIDPVVTQGPLEFPQQPEQIISQESSTYPRVIK